MDQIKLFYERATEEKFNNTRMEAIVLAQAISYASPPSFGENKESFRKKKREWSKFMDSLDYNKKSSLKVIKTEKDARILFGGLGIPIRKKIKDVKS